MPFDTEKYLKLQSEKILDRVKLFGDKLYLEFGGKLFDDFHASRVLPGFEPDTKLKMLLTIKDDVEVLLVINANDIQNNKIRADLGISYQADVLRLIDAYRTAGLICNTVCITKYEKTKQVEAFRTKLKNLGITTYLHYHIEGYPHNVSRILSKDGFEKNEYIKTSKKIVVVTAPGPGSGKMATCLSQIYNENLRGIKAGYAKYETFPVWNLPLNHPINLAYEAATADLADLNMIDPFHLEFYGTKAVNYNRDVDIFPVLKQMFESIYGKSIYQSPTDMGVNMVGFAIDIEKDTKPACDEIIRRYLNSLIDLRNGKINQEVVDKIVMLMQKLNLSVGDRKCVKAALDKSQKSGTVAMGMELTNGQMVDGKASNLLSAPAALILNALKKLAGINDELMLISPSVIEPINELKIKYLGNHNPRLHINEVLIALTISATTNPLAQLAIKQIPNLKGAQAHSTVILAESDAQVLKKLRIDLTTEPVAYAHRLYTK